jgi:hypothetical protein
MRIRKRMVALGLGIVVAAVLILNWSFHYRSVARYQQQLVRAGEKLKLEELLPPPTPPDQNGAPLFRETIGNWGPGYTNLLDKNAPVGMRMVAPGKAMVGWSQPDVRADGTNTWNEVEAALAQYSANLELVREAAEFPVFDFHLDYRQGFTLLLPHLAPLKRSEQRLAAAALCDLHRGDTAAASTNVQAMLGLANAMANERLAISQLVRIAMTHISMTATWELLQSPGVTDDQLAAIQRGWTESRFTRSTEDALALERALGQMMLERMRNSSAQFRQVVSMGSGGPANTSFSFGQTGDAMLREITVGTREAQWRLFLSYPDQLRALQGYQVLLESFRMVQAGQPFNVARSHQQAGLAELGLQTTNEDSGFRLADPDLRSLFSEAVVSLHRMLDRVFNVEAARELTLTAIALKRYQLRHGQYPAQLSALVPEFLPALPRDPADGQPLRYRVKPDGAFLLYSVGEDGVDNGGDASPADGSDSVGWQKGRDLVWPWPASSEEVIAFQQKDAKKHGR